MGRIIALPESFCPSQVLLELIYHKLGKKVPEIKNNIFLMTREAIKYSFIATLVAIREWRICLDSFENIDYVLVDSSCIIRQEFFHELIKRTDFQKEAELDKMEVVIRFGEEIMAWALKQPMEAKRHYLNVINNNLILMRKPQIDNTGCA